MIKKPWAWIEAITGIAKEEQVLGVCYNGESSLWLKVQPIGKLIWIHNRLTTIKDPSRMWIYSGYLWLLWHLQNVRHGEWCRIEVVNAKFDPELKQFSNFNLKNVLYFYKTVVKELFGEYRSGYKNPLTQDRKKGRLFQHFYL